MSQFVIKSSRRYRLVFFWGLLLKNTRGIPENAKKRLQVKPVHSSSRHRAMGLQLRQLFLIARPCQPPQRCVFRTAKELRGNAIRVLTHGLHQVIHMCLCQDLLGASLTLFSNCCSTKRLIRKCGMGFGTCRKCNITFLSKAFFVTLQLDWFLENCPILPL